MSDKDDIEVVRKVLKDSIGINFRMPNKIIYIRKDKMEKSKPKKLVVFIIMCWYWFIVLSPTIIMWELYRLGIISINGIWDWFIVVTIIVILANIISYLLKSLGKINR